MSEQQTSGPEAHQQSDSEDTTGVVLNQRIGADPEVVFEFLTDPKKVLRWMGTEIDIEPKPGGKFWLKAGGTDIAIGEYVEVDPPKRIVFTWGWERSEIVPPGSSTVTITLSADGDDTIVELSHDGLPQDQGSDHKRGWTFYLARLVAVSEGRDPDEEAG